MAFLMDLYLVGFGVAILLQLQHFNVGWLTLVCFFCAGNSEGQLVVDEFIDAREVVSSLAAEYEACERPDYVSVGWGTDRTAGYL